MRQIYAKQLIMEENKEYCYKYPHAAITADNVVFGFDGKGLYVLLIKRGEGTYEDVGALPGGFMHIDETIEQCALRELQEETNAKDVYLEQFHVFSTVDRDPRERVVTVGFLALVRKGDYSNVRGGDDAKEAKWFNYEQLPPLAFDHQEIIAKAHSVLRDRMRSNGLAFCLLDQKFGVDELRSLCEAVFDTKYDRRNFYKKFTSAPYILEDEGEQPMACSRAAHYSFSKDAFDAARSVPPNYPFDF